MEILGLEITWYGHDTFCIIAGKTLYFDPYQLPPSPPPADLILVTHDHFDHCDPVRINQLRKEGTIIVAPSSCAGKLKGNVHQVSPRENIALQGIPIQGVPAYNLNKFRSPGIPFHPKEAGHVGYIVNIGGRKIYHPGDSDFIPEMNSLEDIDIAFLPVSGTYVMTAKEAAKAARAIKPKVAIPMHYGSIVGSEADAEAFRDELRDTDIQVIIMEPALG